MRDDINICFMLGKVISPIKFDFFYNSKKHNSKATCWFETIQGQSSIKIKGYDDIADEMYKHLEKGNILQIIGYLEKNEIVIEEMFYIM